MTICPFKHMSARMSVRMSAHMSVRMSVRTSVSPSIIIKFNIYFFPLHYIIFQLLTGYLIVHFEHTNFSFSSFLKPRTLYIKLANPKIIKHLHGTFDKHSTETDA